ncbi:MAG: prefoldin subunit alpha [Thermoplasmata archaeon]|nr:prefoldin subunit alpha [Thermoplasmata archaeon]
MSGAAAPSAEQQVQEDLVRLDAYRNQLSALLQQHQMLSASRTDHLRAREALDGLERSSAEGEVLIPIGGETYLTGSPDRSGPVLIGIGSGYVAQMERPRAVELLAQRTTQIEQAARELEGQIRGLEERIALVSRRVESLTGQDSGAGEEPADVGSD